MENSRLASRTGDAEIARRREALIGTVLEFRKTVTPLAIGQLLLGTMFANQTMQIVDGEKLPETYELWAKYALASDHRMQKLGRFVVRINIDLEPFRDWCTGHGRPLDKDARMAYAEAIGEQRRAKLS